MNKDTIIFTACMLMLASFLCGCRHSVNGRRKTDLGETRARCTLSENALVARKSAVQSLLGSKILERKVLDDGVAMRFEKDSKTVQAVFDFVSAERSCCGSFLTFEVLLSGGDGPFWLRVRGNEKTKVFIQNMFSVNGEASASKTSPG